MVHAYVGIASALAMRFNLLEGACCLALSGAMAGALRGETLAVSDPAALSAAVSADAGSVRAGGHEALFTVPDCFSIL